MSLESLRNWMQDEDCVVVGCGPSADSIDGHYYDYVLDERYRERWTLACNRAVTWLWRGTHPAGPDFALCVEPPWDTEMWGLMRDHAPLAVFSHVLHKGNEPIDCPRLVLLPDKENVLTWMTPAPMKGPPLICKQSPFYAVAVAAVLGFRRVGIIGVDLTEDRFGKNPHRAIQAYGRLREVAADMGTEVVNLSPESRLSSVPQGKWDDIRPKGWRQQQEAAR